ncbi:MAG: hypothetical protein ABEI77_09000 [Halorientalis sp.]
MARRQDNESGGNDRLIQRRSLLKAAGATAAALTLGSAVSGVSAKRVSGADTVVDLGKQGLESGDNIDPYIEKHFVSGNEVHIPAGEYQYSGAGFGGDKQNCALIGSPEGVVLHRPDPEQTVRPTLFAQAGTVRLENITIKGKRGQEQSRWRLGAAEGATVEVVNVNMPDGTVDGSDSTGIYAGTDHAGLLWIKSCYFSNFGNVALYVSDPKQDGNGPVIVEDCNFVNTGMSSLRFASDKSVCRRCYFEATEKGPSGANGWSQRGIKIDDPGQDVLIEDIDMYWTDVGTYPVQFDDHGKGASGTMRNMRIYNDGGHQTFKIQWDGVNDNWDGKNINLTGGADYNAPSSFETKTGDQATKPNRDYKMWTPVDASVSPGDPAGNGTAGGDSSGSGGSKSTTDSRQLTIEASQNNPDTNCKVSFTVDGQIEYGSEAEPDTDRIEQGNNGSVTATSVKMNPGAVDSYTVTGQVTDYSVTDGYDVTVSVDGNQTSFDELTGGNGGSGDSSGGSDSGGGGGSGGSTGGSDGSAGGNGGSTGGSQSQKILIVDGTGDAEETAKYDITVTGSVERDEQRTTVTDGGLPWDQVRDYVGDNRMVGLVGNGQDAYRFTGTLQSVTIDGEAGLTILEG